VETYWGGDEDRDLGPGTYCSSRHRIPFNQRNEGSKCVSTTRRASTWHVADTARHVIGIPVNSTRGFELRLDDAAGMRPKLSQQKKQGFRMRVGGRRRVARNICQAPPVPRLHLLEVFRAHHAGRFLRLLPTHEAHGGSAAVAVHKSPTRAGGLKVPECAVPHNVSGGGARRAFGSRARRSTWSLGSAAFPAAAAGLGPEARAGAVECATRIPSDCWRYS